MSELLAGESTASLLTGPQLLTCTRDTCTEVVASIAPEQTHASQPQTDSTHQIILDSNNLLYNFFTVPLPLWFYHEPSTATPTSASDVPQVLIQARGFVFVNVVDEVMIDAHGRASRRGFLHDTAYACGHQPLKMGCEHANDPGSDHDHPYRLTTRVVVATAAAQKASSHLLINIHSEVDEHRTHASADQSLQCSAIDFGFSQSFAVDITGSYIISNPHSSLRLRNYKWGGGQVALAGGSLTLKDTVVTCGLYAPNVLCPVGNGPLDSAGRGHNFVPTPQTTVALPTGSTPAVWTKCKPLALTNSLGQAGSYTGTVIQIIAGIDEEVACAEACLARHLSTTTATCQYYTLHATAGCSLKVRKGANFVSSNQITAHGCCGCMPSATTTTTTTTTHTHTTTTVSPIQIVLDKLDFDTADLTQLEARIRASLSQSGVVGFATMPMTFAQGSVIVTLFPFTEADASAATEGINAITRDVQSVFIRTTTTTTTTTTTWVFKCCCYLLLAFCGKCLEDARMSLLQYTRRTSSALPGLRTNRMGQLLLRETA